jgi:hypothetical protein
MLAVAIAGCGGGGGGAGITTRNRTDNRIDVAVAGSSGGIKRA